MKESSSWRLSLRDNLYFAAYTHGVESKVVENFGTFALIVNCIKKIAGYNTWDRKNANGFSIVLSEEVASWSCDHRLHFYHHKYDN